jgi:hypothetical protein
MTVYLIMYRFGLSVFAVVSADGIKTPVSRAKGLRELENIF